MKGNSACPEPRATHALDRCPVGTCSCPNQAIKRCAFKQLDLNAKAVPEHEGSFILASLCLASRGHQDQKAQGGSRGCSEGNPFLENFCNTLHLHIQQVHNMTADHSLQKSEELLASAATEAEDARIQVDTCRMLAESLIGTPSPPTPALHIHPH